jgi:hypothetical protein
LSEAWILHGHRNPMASSPKSRLNAFASDVTPKVIRAAGILLFSSVFAFSQQTPSLTIQGTVSNAASNQPLAAAQVTLTTGPAQGSLPVAPRRFSPTTAEHFSSGISMQDRIGSP